MIISTRKSAIIPIARARYSAFSLLFLIAIETVDDPYQYVILPIKAHIIHGHCFIFSIEFPTRY